MKRIILFVTLLFLTACPLKQTKPILNDLPSLTLATRQEGQDLLALQHRKFKVADAVKYLEKNTSTGHLDVTFGSRVKKVKRVLTDVEPGYHRIHIINGTCVRNQVCQSFETGYGFSRSGFQQAVLNKNPKIITPLKKRVRVYKDLSAKFPNTIFLLSPILEHDLSIAAWRVLADEVVAIWPEIKLINSPNKGVAVEAYRGAWIEKHGQNPGSTQGNSLDGEEGTDINVPNWLQRTNNNKYTMNWSRSYNCRTNSATFIPPKQRNACPSEPVFEMLAHLMDQRPPAPNFQGGNACSSITAFNSPNVWKPLAEDHYEGEPRANAPVAIVPFNRSLLDVLAVNGKKLGQLANGGSFTTSGYWRYYSKLPGGSGLSGYQFEKLAVREGSPWVWVRSGRACKGPFVPGRRAGTYR